MLNDVYKPRVGDVVKCNALNLLFTLVYDEKSDSEYTYGEDFDGGDFDGGRIITRSQMKRLMR